MAENLVNTNIEIELTFMFGMFGSHIPCTRNAYHNNVGGYMKGRNVIDGEKSERLRNQPSLPPNDSEGPPNVRGSHVLNRSRGFGIF